MRADTVDSNQAMEQAAMRLCRIVAGMRGERRRRQILRLCVAAFLSLPLALLGLDSAAPTMSSTPAQGSAQILKWAPGMRVSALAGRADSDLVEFDGGRRMRVGDLRRLDAAAKRMRAAAAGQAAPVGLRAVPAATGQRLSNASDLVGALKRPGTETLQLPSGRTLTAEQLRFLQPEVEKRLGRKLTATPGAPDRSGPAIKVPRGVSAEEWNALMQKPAGTLLESPSGKRITVGEIKEQIAAARARQPTSDRTSGLRR